MNKKKIINDPLYGFITIPNELIQDIISHPWFQRLRRIKQLGLTEFVYPGALHTRFHHALGAMHLMKETLDNLREKGIEINDKEYTGALIAILLHDIGHAPFSHALEHILIPKVSHETLSAILIEELNREFNGELDLAVQIFNNEYKRKFLNQLVSSQLDIDRLDYLNRDSFFTGVSEGKIGAERIIKLINVYNDEIVIEEKGIYSIENFLNSRRLMYWQVYLHKTAISVEKMMIQIISRAKEIVHDLKFNISEELKLFLLNDFGQRDIQNNPQLLESFTALDDVDVLSAVKSWQKEDDKVLSTLCSMLLKRQLLKVELSEQPADATIVNEKRKAMADKYGFNNEEIRYFVFGGHITNSAYLGGDHKINVLTKKGEIVDIANASDLPNIKAMRKIVKKYYLCWPKIITL